MTGGAYISAAGADARVGDAVHGELARQGLAGGFGAPDPEQAILQARALVVLVSPEAETDPQVQRDVGFALSNGRTLVPVVVRDPAAAQKGLMSLHTRIDARAGVTDAVLTQISEAVRAMGGGGRTVAMLNIKGGVGKTVLAANLFTAAHLERGVSVCFVDLDPQHNLSQFFLPPDERNRVRADAHSIYSVFLARGPLSAPRTEFHRIPVQLNRTKGLGKPRLDLIVGDERLFEYTLDGRSDREKSDAQSRFHELISLLRGRYDLVVIDANPCATFLTRCAVTAADHIVAPVRPEKYSLTGLNMLESVTRTIRGRALRASEFSVLLNGVGDRPRSRGGADVAQATRDEIRTAPFFSGALLDVAIPYTTSLRTTPIDRYAANPINLTAMRLLTQRALKEALTQASLRILERARA